MRIIAGQFRGRQLRSPVGLETRPTADRVRETLFNMLATRLGSFEGLTVADLFAGSGALGFEALSRGAARATFVDSDAEAIAAIRANAEKLAVRDRIQVLGASALALPAHEPVDLILADPPYARRSGPALVEAVQKAGWLAPGGWIALETERGDAVDPRGWPVDAERDVGRARLTLIRRA